MIAKNFLWIYILELNNGHFYTGYTQDLAKRYEQHLNGTGRAKCTRSFKPLKIAGCWKLFGTKGDALRVEIFIKRQSRKKKESILLHPETLKTRILDALELNLDLVPYRLNGRPGKNHG
ncbi:MAG: GIY-YIG nuclease family protein [Spirochaetota bacterium]